MSLLCYNKGCGKEFDPETNTDTSCLYHPGVPVFHEGMKGWSCCPKKYTDFQEFLGAQGCTAGKHTNTKPTPPAQQSNSGTVTVIGSGNGNGSEKNIPDSKSTSTPTPTPVPTPVPTAAPLSNVPFVWEKSADPLVKLPVVVSDAVRAAGQPTSSATTTSTTTATAAATTTTTTEQQNENVIPPVGTVCVRNACGKAYENESSLQQDCVHHPGTPVFHEG